MTMLELLKRLGGTRFRTSQSCSGASVKRFHRSGTSRRALHRSTATTASNSDMQKHVPPTFAHHGSSGRRGLQPVSLSRSRRRSFCPSVLWHRNKARRKLRRGAVA